MLDRHVHTLIGLGPRPVGSPANQQAADYIRATFRAAGLDVEEQPYACTAWEQDFIRLEQEGEQLDAAANAFSLPCDVTAPVISAGTIAQLEAVSARGKILLLYGDLARAPLSAKSWFLKDERDDHIIQLLEQIQPAALLAPPTSTVYYGHLTEDWELDLPAATVPQAVARRLMQNADSAAHLCIAARKIPAMAQNIVARTHGVFEKRIVVCAHFDTKINTPGASDNGGGAAALLALAERLSKWEAGVDLEFVAFNSEEYLPIGDDEYVRRGEAYFPSIRCAINMDGIGAMLAANSLTAIATPEEMEQAIRHVAAEFPGVQWVEPWPESNHSTFSFRGIPAVALSSVGARGLAHSTADTIDVMSADKLEEAVALVERLIQIIVAKA
ncbi:M28 family peptidase [Candidatus Chloroploca sp. Khr17]|uniref:M28 family peptidase n=1 Tax=Candidatus Chloroploca sp. Khr17 TaxID=2496869 RepID=UPI00101CD632|nr:M28 family peptidase [Candidatus Chloroploca sp. Khr17]